MSRIRQWWSSSLLAAGVLAATAGLVGSPGAAAEASPGALRSCGTFNGPDWTHDGVTDDEAGGDVGAIHAGGSSRRNRRRPREDRS